MPGPKFWRKRRPPSGYVWAVNLNNGNVNYINDDNNGFVRGGRLVPASECQGVTFDQLLAARALARVGKQPSVNMYEFESRWLPNLLDLQQRINSGVWHPKKTTCFIATAPKAREIHAPDYEDRIVHHLIVPFIDAIFEPIYIADSFSNRAGKGTHEAIERLGRFVRKQFSGRGGGYYLQLDIRNFFYSICRETLWKIIKPKMQKHGTPARIQHLVHALLRYHPTKYGVDYRATAAERALIPPHKRLDLVPRTRGLPIGNYSSQAFANVYMNRLDQFVKHQLGVEFYERYVDDFVLIDASRDRLLTWKAAIEKFLADELRLELKSEWKLRPLIDGIDFLGYVQFPTHRLVRPRVIQHAREKLFGWQQKHVRDGVVTATPAAITDVKATWSSYVGHFQHANSFQLLQDFHERFPWLAIVVDVKRTFPHELRDTPISLTFKGSKRPH